MTRTHTFVGSTVFGYLYQACVMVVGLWLTPFYLRSLGQHGYGVWLVGLQILSIIMLMDFGVVAVIPRDVAQLSGKMINFVLPEELIALIAQTAKVVRWQTFAITIASVAAYLFWPAIAPEIKGPLVVAICAFCLSFPLRLYAATLEGLQDLQFLSQLRIVIWILATAVTVVLLMLGGRLYALAGGYAMNVLLFQSVTLIRLSRQHPALVDVKHWLGFEKPELKDFTRGSWISLGQISQILLDGTYIIAVARILGPSAVVTFTCTTKLVTVLANQPQLFVLSALPGLSQMKTSSSRERIRSVTTVLGQSMLIISGAIVCVIFALNSYFVSAWVGSKLFAGDLLTGMVLSAMLLRHVDLAIAQSLFAMGKERAMAIKAFADGIVVTGSAFVSIRWLGLHGAALAQLAGILLVSLPIDIKLFSTEFNVTRWHAISPFTPYLLRLAITCALGSGLAHYFAPHNYLQISYVGILVLIVYAVLVLPFAWRTPIGGYIQSALDHFRAVITRRGQPKKLIPIVVDEVSGGGLD